MLCGLCALLLAGTAGCGGVTTKVDNTAGRATTYEDPTTTGKLAGVGMGSQDIISMTDRMVRDMLASPMLAGRSTPPRVIIDAAYFHNESTSRINKNSITDRLRTNLNRASQGRMSFIGRHYADMVEKERQLKRTGVTDAGTQGTTLRVAGADYRLGGRITSLDAVHQTGLTSRYHQIIFEMIDLETSEIVWSNLYEFRKIAQDDIIYR